MRLSTLITTASLATFITAASFVTGLRTAEPPLVLATSAPLPTNAPQDNAQLGSSGSPTAEGPVPASTDVLATTEPGATKAPANQSPGQEPVAQPVIQEMIVDSDPINYKYGIVQLRLSRLGTEITDITVLQGDTSYGRDVAYATLVAATLQFQSTDYGNVSGATFTTEAFKLAVESALAKG